MAFPRTTTGSLSHTFVPVRPVGLSSQAPLCLYTPQLISKQLEGTFGHLRYFLGKCVIRLSYPLKLLRIPSIRGLVLAYEFRLYHHPFQDVWRLVVEGFHIGTSLRIICTRAFLPFSGISGY